MRSGGAAQLGLVHFLSTMPTVRLGLEGAKRQWHNKKPEHASVILTSITYFELKDNSMRHAYKVRRQH